MDGRYLTQHDDDDDDEIFIPHNFKSLKNAHDYFNNHERIKILLDIREWMGDCLIDYQLVTEIGFTKKAAFEFNIHCGICHHFDRYFAKKFGNEWMLSVHHDYYERYTDAFDVIVFNFFDEDFFYHQSNGSYAYPAPYHYRSDMFDHNPANQHHFKMNSKFKSIQQLIELSIQPRINALKNAIIKTDNFLK